MKPTQILLDELSKRTIMTTSLITEFEKNKNSVLAIENVLFKYDISADEIKMEDLIRINDQDFTIVLEEMGEEEIALLTESFSQNKEIIQLYQGIISTHGNITQAPQYNEAVKQINKLTTLITDFLYQYKIEQKNHISSLEKIIESYQEFSNKFTDDELNEPIFDMETFHDMLNKCGLDVGTKSAIKKEIGKLNYDLIINRGLSKNENEKVLDKYRIIIERKKQKYGKPLKEAQDIFLAKKPSITIDNTQMKIDEMANQTKIPYNIIANAIVCLMLEKEIEAYDNLISNNSEITPEIREKAIVNCEKLLVLSRKKSPQPMINPDANKEKEIKKEQKDENTIIIEKIRQIIMADAALLKSYSDNDTTRLTEITTLYDQYLNENKSLEKNKITMAFLAETLRLNLIFFIQLIKNYKKDPEQYEGEYKKMFEDLKEYLDTYDIVKKRYLKYQEKELEPKKK